MEKILKKTSKGANMKLFGRVVILRIEAISKNNLDAKIKSLKDILNTSNEVNWGKSYVVKLEDMYEKS